jgi:alanine racemase
VSFGARALIRLGALKGNFDRIREAANGARLMAVVKANAYGHGLQTVVRNLPDADSFAVARYSEAVELHHAGIASPIVLLKGCLDSVELSDALLRGFELVVHCERQVELLERSATGDAIVWLKLDTGMGRLGFEPGRADDLIARLNDCRSVREVRLMTHLARADEKKDDATPRQIAAFRSILEHFDGGFSIANSAGLFGWPEAVAAGHDPSRSWVRAGLCLYGVSPFPGTSGLDFGLSPVMDFASKLIAVKSLRAGDAVGYGGTWRAPARTTLGIVSAGYGDGYTRFMPSGTPVLVDGRRVPLAGRVSMDMAAVDLGADATDQVGAPVTLWGEGLPVEEVAARAGTIPYQLLAGLTRRERSEALD